MNPITKGQKLNKKKFKKAIFSLSLLILFMGIIFFLLFIFKPETGMSQEPQKPKIIFQEARQWQIAADSSHTSTLRPNATGSATNIPDEYPDGEIHWTLVDEESSDGDSTYVRGYDMKDLTKYDLYNLPDPDLTGDINSVTVYINARVTYKTGTAKTVIKDGGTERRGTAVNLGADWATASTTWATSSGGGAWTWDQVNALEAGVEVTDTGSSASTDLQCTQVWAVVDFISPAILTQQSYRWQNDDGDTSGDPTTGQKVDDNTNSAAVDTSLEMEKGERAVWRVQIDNTGDLSTTTSYKIQWATTTDDCTSSLGWQEFGSSTEIAWSYGLSGTNNATMTTSTCASNSNEWANGRWFEATSTTGSFELATSTYTEFGFMIETSNAATDTDYCLRLINEGASTTLDVYDSYGELSIVASLTKRYSKDAVASLATTTADLTYFLDSEGYDDVATDDDTNLDPITSSSNIPVFLFAKKHSNSTDKIFIQWNGSTTQACATNNVILQVYNDDSNSWEGLATSTTCTTSTDFDLEGVLSSNLSYYYDDNNWIYVRVYQESGSQTLKTDYINITFDATPPTGDVYNAIVNNTYDIGSQVYFATSTTQLLANWSFTDDGSGMRTTETYAWALRQDSDHKYWNGSTWQSGTYFTTTTNTTTTVSVSLSVSTSTIYYFDIKAYDKTGNMGTSTSLDNGDPANSGTNKGGQIIADEIKFDDFSSTTANYNSLGGGTDSSLTDAQIDTINKILKLPTGGAGSGILAKFVDNNRVTDNNYLDAGAWWERLDVAVDKNGKAHLAWQEQEGTYYNIDYITIDASGKVGPLVDITTATTYHNKYPSIAVDPNNKSHIVWGETDGFTLDYITIEDATTTLGTKVDVGDTGPNIGTSIAVDSNSKSHIVWQGGDGNTAEILYNTVTNGGSVGTEVSITSNAYQDVYPAIAVDSNNKSHIVWEERSQGTYYNIDYNTIGDGTTTPGTKVDVTDSDSYSNTHSSIALDSSNVSHIVWHEKSDGTYWNIDYITVDDNDATSTKRDITSATTYDNQNPDISVDLNNKSHIVWQSERLAPGTVWNIDYNTVDEDGDVGTVVAVTSDTVINEEDTYPVIGYHPTSHSLFVVWTDYDTTDSDWEISYTRNNPWQDNAQATDNDYADGGDNWHGTDVAVDKEGTAHIVWMATSSGYWQIDYITIDNQGDTGTKVDITTSSATSTAPQIAVDVNKKSHIVWQEWDGSYYNIDYNTVDSSGNLGSKVDVATSTSHNQKDPSIAVDSNNKSHIVWWEKPQIEEFAPVRYNTVDENDNLGTQVTVGSATKNDKYPFIAVDSNNKSHIAWNQTNNINYTTIEDNATTTGTKVNVTASNDDRYSSIAVDSNNKSHIVWCDSVGNDDIQYNTVTDADVLGTEVDITSEEGYDNGYPDIWVDSNNKSHIVWHSKRATTTYWNIDYITIDDSDPGVAGTVVAITNSTSSTSTYPAIGYHATDHRFFAVWQNYDGNDWEISYTYREANWPWDAGRQLTDDANADGGGVYRGADVAVDKDGKAHIVWRDGSAATWDVSYNVIDSTGAATSTIIDVDTADSSYDIGSCSIAVDSNNKSHIVWTKKIIVTDTLKVFYRTVTDSGSLGTEVIVASSPTYNNQYPAIAVDSNQKSHIVWQEYSQGSYWNIDYITVNDNDATSTIVDITTSTTYSNQCPSIAVDSNNKSHIVWEELSGAKYNIDYNTVTDGGIPGDKVDVTTSTSYHQRYSSIAVDSNNKSHIVWTEMLPPDYGKIFYNTITDGGTLGTQIGIATDWTLVNERPSIAVDSNNKSHIVWHSNRFYAAYFNIDYATVDSDGNLVNKTGITADSSYHNSYPAIGYHSTSHLLFTVWQQNTVSGYEISFTRKKPLAAPAGYAESATWVSYSSTASTSMNIANVKASQTTPTSTAITWYLSPDGGTTWTSTNLGTAIGLSNSSTSLTVKAVLTTSDTSVTPEITDYTSGFYEAVAGTIDISGTVYTDEGMTTSATGSVVHLVVNGTSTATTTASTSTGAYLFSNVSQPSTSDVLTVYLDNSSEKGVTVNRYSGSGNVTGLHIYKDRIIVRYDDSGPITIADLDKYDSEQDLDILFTASTTAATALIASSTSEFFVWSDKTFSPGVTGNLSLSDVDVRGTFTATSSQTISVSCSSTFTGASCWSVTSTATFNSASSTVEFTSGSTGKTILTGGSSFWNLTFNGSGGGWTFQDVATTSATTTITNGILSQGTNNFITQSLTIASNATFTKATGSGILIFEGSGIGYFQDDNATKNNLGNVQIGNSPATTNLKSDFAADSLTVNTGSTFNTRGYEVDITNYITIHGTYDCTDIGGEGDETITTLGTNWTVDSGATFTAANSTTTFNGTTTSTINSGGIDDNHDFYTLTFEKSSTATSTLATSTKVSADLIIGSNSILDASSSNYNINVGGSWSNSGIFIAQQGTVTFDATSTGKTISGNLNGGNAFWKLWFNGAGGAWEIRDPMKVGASNATDTLVIKQGAVTMGDGDGDHLEILGKFIVGDGTGNATFTTYSLPQGQSLTININASTSPSSCDQCIIQVGTSTGTSIFELNKNAILRFNSATTVQSGLEVEANGYLHIEGSQDDSGTSTSGTNETTIEDTSKSWSSNEHNGKHVRITSGLAIGKIYDINDTATTTLTRTDNSISTTVSSVDSETPVRNVTTTASVISSNDEGIGRYLHDTTTDTWYKIVDTIEGGASDQIKIIAEPDSFNISNGDSITISDGVKSGDGYEILDYAQVTAESSNHGYIYAKSGSETLIRYADISEMGTLTVYKYGVSFYLVDGSNSNEGVTIEKSRIHNGYWGVFFWGSSNNNATNTKGLSNNAAYSNSEGFYLYHSSSSNNTLTYNNSYGNSNRGFFLFSANNNTLTYNNSYGNSTGFWLSSTSSDNTLNCNNSYSNGSSGFYVYDSSSDNNLTSNNSYGNGTRGFYLGNSSNNNTLTYNSSYSNGTTGFLLNSSSNNTLTSNNSYDNSLSGFYLYDSSNNNTLTSNSSYSNGSDGFWLSSSSNNTLTSNNSYDNSYSGFLLNSSSNNTLTYNNSYGNITGFYLYISCNNNILFSNDSYDNSLSGFYLYDSSNNNTLTYNSSYSNGSYGLRTSNSTSTIIINDNYGVGGANSTADTAFNDSFVGSTVRCYSCNLDSSNELAGVTYTGAYFASFNHDSAATSTKLWGEYTIPDDDSETPQDEGINRFNYASSTWEDSIARVNFYDDGSDSTKDTDLEFSFGAGFATTSATYRVVCNAATTTWTVYRNETNIGTATTSETFTDSLTNLSFTISETNATQYDTYTFVAFADSNNTSTQKILTIMQDGDTFTVGSGETLEIKGGGSTSTDITTVNYNPGSGSWSFYNETGSELTFQEAIINSIQFATGTVTVLNTTLNNESVTGNAVLNVDWYLGVHVVDASATSTDVANATTTISSTSTVDATVWKWSGSGWGSPSTTQVTVTYATGTATGTIPQPGTNGAIRIREYSTSTATTTYYKYNLQLTAQGYSDYDYYEDQGTNYITSASSTESTSTVDLCISESWQRDDIDVNNTEPTLNDPPTYGTWYTGMSSDLEFGLSSLTVDLGTLDSSNNFTATGTTITYVTTTAPSGYLITVYDSAGNDGELTTSTYSIIRWAYDNSNPATWGAGQYGFGYTTDDTNLTGGDPNRFATSTEYAGFTSSTEEVADRPGGNWQSATTTITYKVSVSVTQEIATYYTTITYVCTAQY